MLHRTPTSGHRTGFTLVEMLVATALVVMIMLMFAQIYGGAIGTITQQRGMANNDQKARIVTTLLRNDLQNMTYRQPAYPYGDVQGLVPITPGDEPLIDPNNQLGYFHYSENSSGDPTDDVLQFTARIRVGQRGNADTRDQVLPFTGKAADLSNVDNQPERDDGISGNGRGQSRAAEIAYFLRRGILYRRVLLIRDPLQQIVPLPDQPSNANGSKVFNTFTGGRENYTGTNFYSDFDYSATRNTDAGGTDYLWFHTLRSLDNGRQLSNFPLGVPNTRFGFALTTGRPVEFDSNNVFFGRFTHAETSDDTFQWPGTAPASNPYTRGDLTDSNLNGILDQYANGTRVGEDILLTNVEGFDVEVWDELADSDFDGSPGPGAFVSLGQTGTNPFVSAARYADGQRTNTGFGSGVTTNRVWDSWHGDSTAGGDRDPPFTPLKTQTAANVWGAAAAVNAGEILLPWAGEDLNLNRTLDGGEDLNGNGVLDRPWRFPNGSLRAVCITSGTTGDATPEWVPTPGAIVQDGTAQWQIQDNRIGLKAIRVTIRYRDVGSNLPRQVTIVHSFVE